MKWIDIIDTVFVVVTVVAVVVVAAVNVALSIGLDNVVISETRLQKKIEKEKN